MRARNMDEGGEGDGVIGIAGRASVKPGNPRLSDVRWMLDLRLAMFDRKAGLGQAG